MAGIDRSEVGLKELPDGIWREAAVDVYTPTAFHILESVRLDDGFGSQVHP